MFFFLNMTILWDEGSKFSYLPTYIYTCIFNQYIKNDDTNFYKAVVLQFHHQLIVAVRLYRLILLLFTKLKMLAIVTE